MENKIKAGYSENEKYPNFVRWVKNEQKICHSLKIVQRRNLLVEAALFIDMSERF